MEYNGKHRRLRRKLRGALLTGGLLITATVLGGITLTAIRIIDAAPAPPAPVLARSDPTIGEPSDPGPATTGSATPSHPPAPSAPGGTSSSPITPAGNRRAATRATRDSPRHRATATGAAHPTAGPTAPSGTAPVTTVSDPSVTDPPPSGTSTAPTTAAPVTSADPTPSGGNSGPAGSGPAAGSPSGP